MQKRTLVTRNWLLFWEGGGCALTLANFCFAFWNVDRNGGLKCILLTTMTPLYMSCCRHINPSSIWDEIPSWAGNHLSSVHASLPPSSHYHLQWLEAILLTLSLIPLFLGKFSLSTENQQEAGEASATGCLGMLGVTCGPWYLAPCQKAFLTDDCCLYCIFLQGLNFSYHHQAWIRSSTWVLNSSCFISVKCELHSGTTMAQVWPYGNWVTRGNYMAVETGCWLTVVSFVHRAHLLIAIKHTQSHSVAQ